MRVKMMLVCLLARARVCVCVVLMPLKGATHCVHGDSVVTGSLVVPCVRILKAEPEEWYSKHMYKFVLALKDFVQKLLTKYEDYTFQTASVLDPRFKLCWCNQSESPISKGSHYCEGKSFGSRSRYAEHR
jgi:hypothetical protein